MIEFFRNMFGGRTNSGATAKERLRLVLLSDHLSLAPDLVDSLKADLLEVIARYVDIDRGNADITFEHRNSEIAMLASVPVTGVRRDAPARNGNGAHPLPDRAEPAPDRAEPIEAIAPIESHEAAIEGHAPPIETAPPEPAVQATVDEPAPTIAPAQDATHEPAGEASAVKIEATQAEEPAAVEAAHAPLQSNQAARPPRRRRRRRPPAAPSPQSEIGLENLPASNA
jgi:cell division topological specificity factor